MGVKKVEKKVPKTKVELAREIEVQQRTKFIDALQKLEKQHGYRMIGMVDYSQNGIRPTVGLEKVDVVVEKKEVKKA